MLYWAFREERGWCHNENGQDPAKAGPPAEYGRVSFEDCKAYAIKNYDLIMGFSVCESCTSFHESCRVISKPLYDCPFFHR